jgi:glycosyltransferase involved in cell wall biosynthesis
LGKRKVKVPQDPVVDAIIPTRNRLSRTVQTIRCVYAQTYQNWRLVIVDDASDDGSSDELVRLASEDPRVHVIRLDQRGGPSVARQVGLEAGDGPLVATLDSDDYWYPEKLSKQVRHFEAISQDHSDVGAVLCGHRWMNEQLLVPQGSIRQPPPYSRSPLVSNNMSTPLFVRRLLTEAGGFCPNPALRLTACEHIENYVRFSERFAFSAVQELLVLCRSHGDARVSDGLRSREAAEDMFEMVELHAAHLRRFPTERVRLEAAAAGRCVDAGELRTGIALMRRALRRADGGQKLEIVRKYGPFMIKALAQRAARSARGRA